MNKMIIKLGLLLALTLPAGAMESPEAPEVSARLSDARKQEIMDILSSLQKLASECRFKGKIPTKLFGNKNNIISIRSSRYVRESLGQIVGKHLEMLSKLQNLANAWLIIAPDDELKEKVEKIQNRFNEYNEWLETAVPEDSNFKKQMVKQVTKSQKKNAQHDSSEDSDDSESSTKIDEFNDNIQDIYYCLKEVDVEGSLEMPSRVTQEKAFQVVYKLFEDLKKYIPRMEAIQRSVNDCYRDLIKNITKTSDEVVLELNKSANDRGIKDSNVPLNIIEQPPEMFVKAVRSVLFKIAQHDYEISQRDIALLDAERKADHLGDMPEIFVYADKLKEKIADFNKCKPYFVRLIKHEEVPTLNDDILSTGHLLDEFYGGRSLFPDGSEFKINDDLAMSCFLIVKLKKCMPAIEKGVFFINTADKEKAVEKFITKATNVLADFGKLAQTAGFSANIPVVYDNTTQTIMTDPIAKYIREALEAILHKSEDEHKAIYLPAITKYKNVLAEKPELRTDIDKIFAKLEKNNRYWNQPKDNYKFQDNIQAANYLLELILPETSGEHETLPSHEEEGKQISLLAKYLKTAHLINTIKEYTPKIRDEFQQVSRDVFFELDQIIDAHNEADIKKFVQMYPTVKIESNDDKSFAVTLEPIKSIDKQFNIIEKLTEQRWFGLIKSFKINEYKLKDEKLFTVFSIYLSSSPQLEKIEFVNCDFGPNVTKFLQRLENVQLITMRYSKGFNQSGLEHVLNALPGLPQLKKVEFDNCEFAWGLANSLKNLPIQSIAMRYSKDFDQSGLGNVLDILPSLPKLEKLELDNCKFDQEIGDSLKQLKNVRSIKIGYSEDFDQSGPEEILNALPSLSQLEKLELDNCKFGSEINKIFDQLKNVHSIKIRYPKGIDQSVIETMIMPLVQLPHLEIVDLSGITAQNGSSCIYLVSLLNNPSLTKLILKNNTIDNETKNALKMLVQGNRLAITLVLDD